MKGKVRIVLMVFVLLLGFIFLNPFTRGYIIKPILNSVDFDWYHTWGGSVEDNCSDILIDASDNFYIVGSTASYGNGGFDICLVKYNNSGNYMWNRTWGGIENDYGQAIAMDSIGNIYIVGYTESFGAGGVDVCLIKYDNLGSYMWNRTWGSIDDDHGFALVLDSQNNIYITGDTFVGRSGRLFDYDIVLLKYNDEGNYQWNQSWGDDRNECAYTISLDLSSNIFVGGMSKNFPSTYPNGDMCVVKFSPSGSYEWDIQRTWNGKGVTYDIIFNPSGDLLFVGFEQNKIEDVYIPYAILNQYDSSGGFIRNRALWDNHSRWQAIVANNTSFYITGFIVNNGNSDILLQYKWGGINNVYTWGGINSETASGIALDSLGNIYIAATTKSYGAGGSDMCLLKYSPEDPPEDPPEEPSEAIYGYNMFFLIGGILGIIFIIKKSIIKHYSSL